MKKIILFISQLFLKEKDDFQFFESFYIYNFGSQDGIRLNYNSILKWSNQPLKQ